MYDHKKIEKKWQEFWLKNKTFKTTENGKKKFYVLDMFPYPSGAGLHVGHPEGYTATDIIARYKRFNKYDVLHPIGWDAFGLPAEQYAIQTGNNPAVFTEKNINVFRQQLQSLGFSYDYDKEVNTTDPKYYKWTQWIFSQMYKNGLAEIKEIEVNWCPELGTVLANEELLDDGKGNKISERGGFPVIKKPMKQWILKITNYADKLIEGLNEVEWPNSLVQLQKNWIGKMDGYEINFETENKDFIKVFTTRIDTIFGVTFLVLNPNNEFVKKYFFNDNKIKKFIDDYNKKTSREISIEKDKKGIFTGLYAFNPITREKVPVWLGEYVLQNVGTGAVMGVPAEDERDKDFAIKNNLKIIDILKNDKYINSEFINDLNNKDKAIEKIVDFFKKNKLPIKKVSSYKLKDWVFARQRYWGEPFPIMFDEKNNIYLIDDLVELPAMNNIKPSGTGESPLANNKEWVNIEVNGKKYHRETNTMPQWAGSSWYYLAYILKNDDNTYIPLNSKEAYKKFKKWLPVDLYIGGQEHAVLHLLYARFWHKVLYDLKIVPTSEPFFKLVNQGMILGTDNQKMSKSKGNVINPNEIVNEYGADTLRVYEMFMGPLTDSKPWNTKTVEGTRKWLERVWRLFEKYFNKEIILDSNHIDNNLESIYNQTIRDVTKDIEELKFNTAISKLMVYINHLYKVEKISNEKFLKDFLILLSPFAPHISEELINKLSQEQMSQQSWPKWDENKIKNSLIVLSIQVNGKLRGTLELNHELDEKQIIKLAKENSNVKKYLENKEIKKIIFIKNKNINFVI